MADTDRLAALLDAALVDHEHDQRAPLVIRRDHAAAVTYRSCAPIIAARLIAAGVTLAPTPDSLREAAQAVEAILDRCEDEDEEYLPPEFFDAVHVLTRAALASKEADR